MARFLALIFGDRKGVGLAAARFCSLLGLMLLWVVPARAQTMMQMNETPAAPATNAAPAEEKGPAVKTPAATAPKPGAPALPAPVPDTFNRYGKIWAPSDDVEHPIKLNVQFPGVGEMKVPSPEELSVRDKLEQLASLSDDEIRAQLALWPPFAKMKLADEGQLLIRIQQFKEQRTKIAAEKARELGLVNSLTPEQKVKFEKEYWDKRLQMDRELAKQFYPILQAKQQKLKEDLFREYSTPGTVVPAPHAPKTPAVPIAQTKPGASTNAPSVTPPNAGKPPVMPIAQGNPAPGSSQAAPNVAH